MHVQAKLFASLQRYAGVKAGSPIDLDLPDGATVADLMQHLRVPSEEVRLVYVNGCAHSEDWQLASGDEVGIFPPIGGG